MSVADVANEEALEKEGPVVDQPAEEHDEYLPAMNPKPDIWPFVLAMMMTLLPVGALLLIWGSESTRIWGYIVLGLGSLLCIVPTMGWLHNVIVDKWAGHFGVEAQGKDLVLGTKLFFLSEIAVFGSIFAYYFVQRTIATSAENWPLPESPDIGVLLPGIGLVVLIISSFTCELAHKAILKGRRGLSKDWLIVTMVLGFIFLFIQGYEYGELVSLYQFTPDTNWFGTLFYVLTGFHGFHVMTGLIMLFICYGRLEFGHYTPKRHFSMLAASWYWHLVDVVWIFVFVFVYCGQKPL